MNKQHHLWVWLIFSINCLYIPQLVWARNSPKPKYDTIQAYVTENFQGSIEIKHHFLESSRIAGGIAIGYYLHKYYHKLSTEDKGLKKNAPTYSHATKTWSIDYLARDTTRDGEASFVLEVGVELPAQVAWRPELHNKSYIVEKFLHVPICLKWILPISFWSFDIFTSFSVGCMIRYLRNSVYVSDLSTNNLRGNPETRLHQVDLKNLPHMPNFYYDILVESGFVFPVGIYVGLVCSIPLDPLIAHAILTKKLDNNDKLDNVYIRFSRDFHLEHILACKVGFDFCRLLKYFNSL